MSPPSGCSATRRRPTRSRGRVTFFASARAGLTQFPEDSKPANAFGAGGGLLFPGGPFRDTSVTVVLGQDRAFSTNPYAWRTRMDFAFVFNALPNWKDELPFVPHATRSLRGLIEVTIDRNFFGRGPDTFQTFLGMVVDFRQLLVKGQ